MRLESTCKPRKGLGLFASLFASQLSFQLSTLSSLDRRSSRKANSEMLGYEINKLTPNLMVFVNKCVLSRKSEAGKSWRWYLGTASRTRETFEGKRWKSVWFNCVIRRGHIVQINMLSILIVIRTPYNYDLSWSFSWS